MAPGTRRGNRAGYPEHDDFEGLPVRQWRHQRVNVAPPPRTEMPRLNDRWSVEVPYGMPRDWLLLPPHSQSLLRAARSGALHKRSAAEQEEAEAAAAAAAGTRKRKAKALAPTQAPTAPAVPGKTKMKKTMAKTKSGPAAKEAAKGEKPEKKEEAAVEGVVIRTWKQVPRAAEGSTTAHLAKRRKGTVTLETKAEAAERAVFTVTRATVRRVDAAGNPYEQTITLADGEQVEGEIISTTVVSAIMPEGDAAAQQAAPPVRKPPPPPRRKGKGAGRKKKKGPPPIGGIAPDRRPAPQDMAADGASKPETQGPTVEQTAKQEADAGATANQDSEMADPSAVPSDEEDGDDGDEADEGEGGGDKENKTRDREADNDQDHDMTESSALTETPFDSSSDQGKSSSPSEDDHSITRRIFPPGPHNPLHLNSAQFEGSPLKNVMLLSPTDPSPAVSPVRTTFPQDTDVRMGEDEAVAETVPTLELEGPGAKGETLLPKSGPARSSLLPSLRQDVDADLAHHKAKARPVAEDTPSAGEPFSPSQQGQGPSEMTAQDGDEAVPTVPVVDPVAADSGTDDSSLSQVPSVLEPQPPSPSPPAPSAGTSRGEGGADDDLLGGLEAELDRQSEASNAERAAKPTPDVGDASPAAAQE